MGDTMDTTKRRRRHMRRVIVTISLAVAIITMIAPNQLSIYASPRTEDDGYTYPDDATEEEKEEIDEREQEAWEDAGRPGDDDDNNDNDNDNEIPECQNGVTQRCVIEEIGLICSPGHDLSNPSIVGGGHACQDIYAGTYKPDPDPDPDSESKLKECGDGIVAVSCGVGRYWCSGGNGDSFHTNDWRDCEDAIKKENSSLNNNDNNFNSNNDNNENSNSDNIPECKRDVLQKCKLSGNTGLLCGVEDLKQGDYNPSVIGNGHACHDVYIGTYNQLLACKDGTYAVSCGSIGVLPGIP